MTVKDLVYHQGYNLRRRDRSHQQRQHVEARCLNNWISQLVKSGKTLPRIGKDATIISTLHQSYRIMSDDEGSERQTDDVLTEIVLNPMQVLRNKTLDRIGMSYERAFAIDDMNLGTEIGEFHMTALVEKFYSKIYTSDDEEFRAHFTSTLEDNVQNLTDYLMQRLGGDPYYSDRKGFPALAQRHCMVMLTTGMARKWLDYMEEAFSDLPEEMAIDPEYAAVIMDFLTYTANFLVIWQEEQQEHTRDVHF